ncbi:MAG: hypothetical protein GY820_22165 [Gammaproteobacteria bacterium]|nr:hypothetical protein [Gammaproteobacteria bacterium]
MGEAAGGSFQRQHAFARASHVVVATWQRTFAIHPPIPLPIPPAFTLSFSPFGFVFGLSVVERRCCLALGGRNSQ